MTTDLTIVRGDVMTLRIQVLDPPTNGVRLPTNLTGKRLSWIAKLDIHQDDPTIEKLSTNGGIVVAAPLTGAATMELAEADTENLEYGALLVWGLRIDDNPGNQLVLISGTLQIIPELG